MQTSRNRNRRNPLNLLTGFIGRLPRRPLLSILVGATTLLTTAGLSGCRQQQQPDTAAMSNPNSPDPAAANMAPPDSNPDSSIQNDGQTLAPAAAPMRGFTQQPPPQQQQPIQNESQQRADEYARTGGQAGAPPPDQQGAPNPEDQAYEEQIDAGQEALEAPEPPPELPVYQQPEAPDPDYLWTPGYWSYAPAGYFWVPGAWCASPYIGALWTPGYWGFYGGRYRFYHGYWGPHIGFYGGINYGFGYVGTGYYGGYWNNNHFYYNRAVNNINASRINYAYNRAVVMNNHSRVAFNGGRGGLQVRPNASELTAMRGPRTPPMSAQLQNQRQAAQNRQQFFNQNRGRPAMATATRPFVADRGITRPEARPMPANRPGQPGGRPGEVNRPQVQPTRPGEGVRPGGEQGTRPGQPGARPENRPGETNRPGQPNIRPTQPGSQPGARPENRPAVRPNEPQVRPTQPQVRPENRLAVQPQPNRPSVQPNRPQVRPSEPQVRPQPETRPAPRPESRPTPQPQPRPQMQPRPMPQNRPAPQPRPMPQQQARPMPQQQARPMPQQQARPMQQARPEAPRTEGRPR